MTCMTSATFISTRRLSTMAARHPFSSRRSGPAPRRRSGEPPSGGQVEFLEVAHQHRRTEQMIHWILKIPAAAAHASRPPGRDPLRPSSAGRDQFRGDRHPRLVLAVLRRSRSTGSRGDAPAEARLSASIIKSNSIRCSSTDGRWLHDEHIRPPHVLLDLHVASPSEARDCATPRVRPRK